MCQNRNSEGQIKYFTYFKLGVLLAQALRRKMFPFNSHFLLDVPFNFFRELVF